MASKHALLLMAVTLLASQHAAAQALFTDRTAPGGNVNTGQAVYTQACMVCHGPRLEGSPFAPGLIGQAFTNKWRGKPSAELLKQMRETMPPKGTGAVRPEVFPDLLAFLVKANVDGIPVAGNAPPPRFGGMPAAVVPAAAIPKPLTPAQAQKLSSLSPVTEVLLAAPPEDAWLMWRRTFDAAGFSPLRQIDRGNVQRLRQAWTLPIDSSTNEITPLVHEGVLFVNSGVAVLAVDAASGTPLWRYQRETLRPAAANANAGAGAAAMRFNYGGNQQARVKSMAIYGHSLFVPTPDGSVVALDIRSGRLVWERALTGGSGANTGLMLSSGPLVARGVVMIGASLGLTNKGGCFIVGLDAATGAERWRFNTVARPGTTGGDTWNDAPAEERFGAGVWTTGSFDPQLNLAYFGVGNTYTTATLLEARPGASGVTRNDGLFTNATIALRPETGELVWYHQHHRRDVWDQDWAFEQTVVTLGSGANARRAVVTGGKTAVFEAVDAATGKFLFAQDTGLTNLFLSIDATTGEKRTNPALEPVSGRKLLLCPSNLGARNWPATTLNPGTGTLFIPMVESCADFTYEPRSRSETAGGGSDIRFSPQNRPDSDGKFGRMIAIDLATHRVQWTHRQTAPLASSLLATAGGVVFMGDLARNFGAYDQVSGAVLWNTQLPAAAESTPVTYAVDGRQFIAVVSGEGSHLGTQNRRLDSTLATPKRDIALVVFALPDN